MTECRLVGIEGDGRRVTAVVYETPSGPQQVPVDYLFSTMPINDFIAAMRFPVPAAVREAAAGLDYCSMSLLYLKVERERVFDVPIVYFSDPAVPFNRIYDVGQFSRECVPEGKTALCIEHTCNEGDAVWQKAPEELAEDALRILGQYGMLSKDDVEGLAIRRLTHSYPRFRVDFEDRMETILNYLSTLENVLTLGRQGLFCYANVDDALHMGFRATEMLRSVRKIGVDYAELFPNHVMI
jgi:protoporphyrinogen oxidase